MSNLALLLVKKTLKQSAPYEVSVKAIFDSCFDSTFENAYWLLKEVAKTGQIYRSVCHFERIKVDEFYY